MGKLTDANERLQKEKPYLWGALVGLLFVAMNVGGRAALGMNADAVTTLIISVASIAVFSLFLGSVWKARQKRSGG